MAGAPLTWDTLRELAGFRSEKGCAVSLYVDLDPSTAPTAADIETRFNSLLNEAERHADAQDYDHEQKQALLRDLNRVRVWWEADFDRSGTNGVAVFASSLDGLWEVLSVPDPVPDEVWSRAAWHYDEKALAGLVLHVALVNLFNRLNVGTRQPAGDW